MYENTPYIKYGIECNEGWKPLYETAILIIEKFGGQVLQVKEKFGELRIYFHIEDPVTREYVHRFVSQMEVMSSHVCEACGKPGKIRREPGRWIRTLCDEHEDEYQTRHGTGR